jgi:hypothetical protein
MASRYTCLPAACNTGRHAEAKASAQDRLIDTTLVAENVSELYLPRKEG